MLLMVLFVVGGAKSQRGPIKRWPYHREQTETQMAQLQTKLDALEAHPSTVEAATRQPAKPPAETPPAP